MYDLCKILYNPFGNRRVDVAHEAIQSGLRKLADALITSADKALPPVQTVMGLHSPGPHHH